MGGAALVSASLPFDGRTEGDKFRELDRRDAEPDRGGTDGVVLCLACSSAMRASMAPRMRCKGPGQLDSSSHK